MEKENGKKDHYLDGSVRLRQSLDQLTKARNNTKNDYFKLIATAVDRSLNIYLKAIEGKSEEPENEKLLKIGELAKATNQTVPTIRHWTKEGLLQVAEITESGYQMYSQEMINRIEKIQKMKEKRMTLEEIKLKIVE